MDDIKQVIVIRKDLKMRRGKEIAQGAHAAMAFLTTRRHDTGTPRHLGPKGHPNVLNGAFSDEEWSWMANGFRKMCVTVGSFEELMAVHQAARDSGVESHLIIDSGATEFHGEPTATAVAVGPDQDRRIDPITGELKLY